MRKTVLLFGLISSLAAPAKPNTIEVMHWWVSESEAGALSVLSDAYTAQGGTWIDAPFAGQDVLTDALYARLRDGFPPSAVQWHATSQLGELYRSGVLASIDLAALTNLRSDILPMLLVDNELAAVPIGLHGFNWSYYNAEIMSQFEFGEAQSWAEFLDQMELVQAAGRPTIAIGSSTWNHGIVFEQMVLSRGTQLFSIFETGVIRPEHEGSIRAAIDEFIRFETLVRQSGVVTEEWSAASLAVAEGRATVQIMGDWAKGEMVANGFVPGEDFLCRIAPGTENVYLLNLDVFVLPRSDDPLDISAQAAFVDLVLDPSNQAEFSRRKGALPVVNNVDLADLDECGRLGLQTIERHGFVSNHLRGASRPAVDEGFTLFINDVISGELINADEAMNRLMFLLARANGQTN